MFVLKPIGLALICCYLAGSALFNICVQYVPLDSAPQQKLRHADGAMDALCTLEPECEAWAPPFQEGQ